MRTERSSRYVWHYNRAYGLAGLAAAVAIVVGMRDDLALGHAWAVAITSGAGWTRQRVSAGAAENYQWKGLPMIGKEIQPRGTGRPTWWTTTWVLLLSSAALGLGLWAASWAGGHPGLGAGMFVVMAVFGAALCSVEAARRFGATAATAATSDGR